MQSSMFDATTIPLLEQVVNFTELRHGVLAGNIANLDTPGYQTRDLSPELFRENLREAVELQHRPPRAASGWGNYGPLSPTTDRADRDVDAFDNVKQSMKSILRHDGTNVGVEQQINEMVKNQMEHNMAVGIMSAQFRLLRAAITERAI